MASMAEQIDVRTLTTDPSLVGRTMGPGPWHHVTQAQVDQFAEATGDDQWIHTDVERAAAGPFGTTIAHGYLTLALLPMLQRELWTFVGADMGVNYGLDKLRFPSAVKVGARVRLRATVLEILARQDGSILLKNEATIEIEGSERPACVAQTLSLIVPTKTT